VFDTTLKKKIRQNWERKSF